jgi:hypothetical protein
VSGSYPLSLILTVSLWAGGVSAPTQREPLPLSPSDADRFATKLAEIVAQSGARPAKDVGRARRTVVTEPELNAYLRYRAQAHLPAGVVEPYVWALGDGRLSGMATVDLDQVRTSRERGWLDPMRLLGGRLPVSATGVLRTSDGIGRLELESARVGSIPVPLTLLQELVTFYSRSEADPDGIRLDEPFALPAGIRHIDVGTGQAVVVQ